MTESSGKKAAKPLQGIGMVDSIKLDNFKAFRDAELKGFTRINVIVGDNGVGKSSLMEAMHLALSGNPASHLACRTWRGLDTAFNTQPGARDTDAVYRDLFKDPSKPASVALTTTLPSSRKWENRSVRIENSTDFVFRPPTAGGGGSQFPGGPSASAVALPTVFKWTGADGMERLSRTYVSGPEITIEGTGENIPEASYFATTNPISAAEIAKKFTALRGARKHPNFIKAFRGVFEFVEDMYVGSEPAPILMADTEAGTLPVASISGGVNRAAAILLAIASREDGLVMVDDAESSIYHQRLTDFSRVLISMAREYRTQLMLTTHSKEWLKHFLEAAGDKVDDITLWRLERGEHGNPIISRFSGEDFAVAIEYGEEIR